MPINKLKDMREFTIEINVPEGKKLNGVLPFNAVINGNRGRFKIYATSYDEAVKLVQEYLER